MKDVYIFAIETSCDETSASIIKNGNTEIATVVLSQIDIHKKFGGVVPEIASRNHTGAITMVFEECLKKANMTFNDIDAIAVTYGPGLNGALLIGIEAAKALSFATGKPLVKVNHMAGHIYANKFVGEFKFPLLCLVVSGGHTEIVYMDKEFSFKKIGSTLDDSVGEAYDKVARVVGIPEGLKKIHKVFAVNFWISLKLLVWIVVLVGVTFGVKYLDSLDQKLYFENWQIEYETRNIERQKMRKVNGREYLITQ